jgi:hypothetical protein
MSETETADPRLTALVLAEEAVCAGYVAARKAQIQLAAPMASLYRLTIEQPRRADYRQALTGLASQYRAAKQRTDLAYARWQEAQVCTDLRWTDTAGRARGQAGAAGRVA